MPGTAYARSARSLVGLASAAARPQLLAPVVPQWARAGRSRPRLWWRCRAGGLSGGPRRTGRRPSAGCPRGGRRRKSDKLPQAVSGATQCNSQSARGQPGPRHGPVGAGSEACTLGQGGGGRPWIDTGRLGWLRARAAYLWVAGERTAHLRCARPSAGGTRDGRRSRCATGWQAMGKAGAPASEAQGSETWWVCQSVHPAVVVHGQPNQVQRRQSGLRSRVAGIRQHLMSGARVGGGGGVEAIRSGCHASHVHLCAWGGGARRAAAWSETSQGCVLYMRECHWRRLVQQGRRRIPV